MRLSQRGGWIEIALTIATSSLTIKSPICLFQLPVDCFDTYTPVITASRMCCKMSIGNCSFAFIAFIAEDPSWNCRNLSMRWIGLKTRLTSVETLGH